MKNEHDPIKAAKSAFEDIVDETPLAPPWEVATRQHARLTRVEPRRSHLTALGVAAVLAVVAGSIAVFTAFSGTPSNNAGATIDYVKLRWSQEVVMVCEGMTIVDDEGWDEATIEMWGPDGDGLVRMDLTAPDGSVERYIYEPTASVGRGDVWSTSGDALGRGLGYRESDCLLNDAGGSSSYSMADPPGGPDRFAFTFLGLPITDRNGQPSTIEEFLQDDASVEEDTWRGFSVTVYSRTATEATGDIEGTFTTESEVWYDSVAQRYEREIYRTTSNVLGTVNYTIEVVERGIVNPEDVSFSTDGLIPDPRNDTDPPLLEDISTTTSIPGVEPDAWRPEDGLVEIVTYPPADVQGRPLRVCAAVPGDVTPRFEIVVKGGTVRGILEANVVSAGESSTCWTASLPSQLAIVSGGSTTYHKIESGSYMVEALVGNNVVGTGIVEVSDQRWEPIRPTVGPQIGANTGFHAMSELKAKGFDARLHGPLDGIVENMTEAMDIATTVHLWTTPAPDAVQADSAHELFGFATGNSLYRGADFEGRHDPLIESATQVEQRVAMPSVIALAEPQIGDHLTPYFTTVAVDGRSARSASTYFFDEQSGDRLQLTLALGEPSNDEGPWLNENRIDGQSRTVFASKGDDRLSLTAWPPAIADSDATGGAVTTTTQELTGMLDRVIARWNAVLATNSVSPFDGRALLDSHIASVVRRADAQLLGPTLLDDTLPDADPASGEVFVTGSDGVEVLRFMVETEAIGEIATDATIDTDGSFPLFIDGNRTWFFCLGTAFKTTADVGYTRRLASAICALPPDLRTS